MPCIGVRDFKTRASEVIRDVHDNHVRYTVTNRREPLAILIPYSAAEEAEVHIEEDPWQEFLRLREMIGKDRKEPFSAVELMQELRR